MKKILLGLFLVLGAVSFSAPSRVDTNKIKQNGYKVLIDTSLIYSVTRPKNNNDKSLSIIYNVGILKDDNAIKEYSESMKDEQSEEEDNEYIGSGESEAGYIHKFYSKTLESYFYIIVGKSLKVKGYTIVATLDTQEDYSSKADLKKAINFVITEADKYLK